VHLITCCWPIKVCSQNGEIMLCDRNFSQADESLQQPRSLAGQSVCNWVFPRCLRCSYSKSVDAHRPESPSERRLASKRLNTYRSEKPFEQKLLKQTKHISYPTHTTREQFQKQTKGITGLYERFINCISDNRQCASNTHTHTHTHSFPRLQQNLHRA
jgi:hypothetical protein